MKNDKLNTNLNDFFDEAKNDSPIISQSESRQLIENAEFASADKLQNKIGINKMSLITTTAAAAIFAGVFAINNSEILNNNHENNTYKNSDNNTLNTNSIASNNNNNNSSNDKSNDEKSLPISKKDLEVIPEPKKEVIKKIVIEKTNAIPKEDIKKSTTKDKHSLNIQCANVIELNSDELHKLGVKVLPDMSIEFIALQSSQNPRKITLTKNSSAIERSKEYIKSPEPKFVTDKNGNKIISLFTSKNKNALLANVSTREGVMPIATISDKNPNLTVRTMSIDMSNKEKDQLTSGLNESLIEFRKIENGIDVTDSIYKGLAWTVADNRIKNIVKIAQNDKRVVNVFNESYIKSGNEITKTKENIKDKTISDNSSDIIDPNDNLNIETFLKMNNANTIIIRKNILNQPKPNLALRLQPGQKIISSSDENEKNISLNLVEVANDDTHGKLRTEEELSALKNSNEMGDGYIFNLDSNKNKEYNSLDKEKINKLIGKYIKNIDINKLEKHNNLGEIVINSDNQNIILDTIIQNNISQVNIDSIVKSISSGKHKINIEKNVQIKVNKDNQITTITTSDSNEEKEIPDSNTENKMTTIVVKSDMKYSRKNLSDTSNPHFIKNMPWAAKDFDEMPAVCSNIFEKDSDLTALMVEYKEINKLIPISIKLDNSTIDYILWYEPSELLISSLPTDIAYRVEKEYIASKSGETCGNTPNPAPLMDVWKACSGDLKNLGVVPNPAKENVTVSYELVNAKNISISLNDLTGNKVAELKANSFIEKGNHSELINLPNNIPSGMYYVVLISDQNETAIQRIIIQ